MGISSPGPDQGLPIQTPKTIDHQHEAGQAKGHRIELSGRYQANRMTILVHLPVTPHNIDMLEL